MTIADNDPRYAELITDIVRGARRHYADITTQPDPDLELLLGDRDYALGLSKLAQLGDLEETARLAELIATVAQAQADGDPEHAQALLREAEIRLGAGR